MATWRTKLQMIVAVLALCLFLLGLVACQKVASEPQRPPGVPKDAFWVGGAEGGVFVLLGKKVGDPRYIYRVRIYQDSSGVLLYGGRLAVVPQDRPELDIGNSGLFSGWDGENLYLRDGRKMRAVRE